MTARAATLEAAPVAPAAGGRRTVRAFDGAMLLSAATALSGLLIYVFHVFAARALGPDSYGRIAVLWAALFVIVVVLFRPIEQTTARALADRRSRDERGTPVVRAATILAAAIAAGLTALLAVGYDVVASALFEGDTLLAWTLLAGVVIYAAMYLVRGITSGIRWFGGYGLLLLADAVARIVLAIPLLVVASESVAATAMVGAGLVGLALTLAFGRRRLGDMTHGSEGAPFPPRPTRCS